MRPAGFFYTPNLMGYAMGTAHPLKPIRLQMTYDLLEASGAFGPDGWLDEQAPRPATPEEAAACHDPEYLAMIQRLEDGVWNSAAARYGFGTADNPVFPGVWSSSLSYTGATIGAAEYVLRTGWRAINIGGGLHHAHYARAAGFCVLNDPAVAIHRLLRDVDRVAYIDIDAHHGDGVQELFYDNPRVLTLSMHESGRTLFPGTGETDEIGEGPGRGASINVPLCAGTGDEAFLWAFENVVPAAVDAFRPDVLVTQLGCDAHHADPLAHLNITTAAYEEMFARFDGLGLPWVATGGGGYNVHTVARAWTLACAAMSGQTLPDALPDAYKALYGGKTLRDTRQPETDDQESVARFAEASVGFIQREVAPILQGRAAA